MLITKIRIKNEFPENIDLQILVAQLEYRFARAGFITKVYIRNSSSIKIGLWMQTFKLDISKHDRNLRYNPYQVKLTSSPNWDQRVKFNKIVNVVLNKWKVSANVKSGPFTIRKGKEVMDEYDWENQVPIWVRDNQRKGYFVEACDEKLFIEARRIEKNKKAQLKRKSDRQRLEKTQHLKLV